MQTEMRNNELKGRMDYLKVYIKQVISSKFSLIPICLQFWQH